MSEITEIILPQMLTTAQAAAALHCHTSTLYRHAQAGRLHRVRTGSQSTLWYAAEVAALLQPLCADKEQ